VLDTAVFCGGARVALRPHEAALLLQLTGPDANITLHIDDISRPMVADVPEVLTDLLEIATYVYCADQLVSRGGAAMQGLGSQWRRRLRFVVPVRAPDLWNSVVESLVHLLSFLSEDEYRFEFVRAAEPVKLNTYLDFSKSVAAFQPDEVLLFSGGLDSLTGTVDVLESCKSRLLLVSHQSSSKMAAVQKRLADDLKTRFPGRVMRVPIRITKHRRKALEFTQRTRSFLFAALAVTLAQLAGKKRINLSENGITSFNLAIAGSVVGARATRSTHPKVLHGLSAFLAALLREEIEINSPFLWNTKAEVCRFLAHSNHRDLCAHSVSCSRVHEITRLKTHCGRCSQCIDRRFATLAAELGDVDPEEMYEVELLTGARKDGEDRTMAESFVRHALELHQLSGKGFVGRFMGQVSRAFSCIGGMSADDITKATFSLHQRHAKAVINVLESGFKTQGARLADQTLPQSCLLRIVAGTGLKCLDAPIRDPTVGYGEGTPDSRDFGTTSEIQLAVNPAMKEIVIRGIPPVTGHRAFRLLQQLVEGYESDRARGQAPENYGFIPAKTLRSRLSVEDDSLRRCVLRFRRRVATLFERHCGLPLASDAVIQSKAWRGYRINPAVRVLAYDQIARAGRHETSVGTSRVTKGASQSR
jgi:7-cyano-7-deazaguanine synthase in queuosine biosynthesis